MSPVDYLLFIAYMIGVLGVGYYFYRKNETVDDFYVGGRNISSVHVGLSIAATDVGGGFSIGLGGLGYIMGLSGSWLLFTGLLGAWLSAVLILPRIKKIEREKKLFTFPQFLEHRYNQQVALMAALISAVGYLGFTGAQILAGAKLASVTLFRQGALGLDPMALSLVAIGAVVIGYTALGGLKAVIYTDSIQWTVLISGLLFLALPLAIVEAGGFSCLRATLPPEFWTLTNVEPVEWVNWIVTITPVWFVAMTIYQRIYACPDIEQARRAWYIGGLFEYPVMAFSGAALGMISSALFPGVEPETGLLILIREVLPVGVTGLVVAAYFSAIMSTADSCLMASSGNVLHDLVEKRWGRLMTHDRRMRLSRLITLILGITAVFIASSFETVLNAILYAYSFLVAGLFIPTLGAFFRPGRHPSAALAAMVAGGGSTIVLQVSAAPVPWGLDPTLPGLLISALVFAVSSHLLESR